MKSYLSHLECTACAGEYQPQQSMRTCAKCGKALFARYDVAGLKRGVSREVFATRPATLWRFFELLPVQDPGHVVTLGEGVTPLLPAVTLGKRLGIHHLYIKDEGLNPTATFKARGMTVAVSRAKELGIRRLSLPSAGNAAGALAAYAARADLEAHLFMPRDAPEANRKEAAVTGARVTLVEGHIGDAGHLARAKSQEEGCFDLSTLQEPYRVEGKKTMGLEIAMDLGWRLPDVILYPTGGGTGIIGMWKVFRELLELGWVEGPQPRFIAVQAEGCQPIVKAFREGAEVCQPWRNPKTVAHGLRVPHPFADALILRAVRETGGTSLAVTDGEMVKGMKEMATAEGIFPCPEGAATLVALKHLLADGVVGPETTVVLLNTGWGLKYLELVE
ncbi:MAG: threonine synthase [Candidatus Methylomirabilales bacterium]